MEERFFICISSYRFFLRKFILCIFIDRYSGCRELGGFWFSCVIVDIILNFYLRIKIVCILIIEIIYIYIEC